MNNLFKGAALFIGGAIAGAAAALLLTPKTGEEVRKEIADLAEDVKKSAQDYCEQVKKDISDKVAEMKAPKEAKPESKKAPKKNPEA